MSDHELLKLAAKAAGIDWFDEPALQAGKGLHMKSGPFWNPLADDGDALRLAVTLGIIINPDRREERTVAEWGDAEQCLNCWYGSGNLGEGAATRRAIVRAAAAIGEEMP